MEIGEKELADAEKAVGRLDALARRAPGGRSRGRCRTATSHRSATRWTTTSTRRPRSPYVFELVPRRERRARRRPARDRGAAVATVQSSPACSASSCTPTSRRSTRDRRAGRGARGGAARQGLGRGRPDPRRALAPRASWSRTRRTGPSGGASRARARSELGGEQVEGRRAVLELLRAGSRRPRARVPVERGRARRRRSTRSSSGPAGALQVVAPERIEQLARSDVHQGVVAMAPPLAHRRPRRAARGAATRSSSRSTA